VSVTIPDEMSCRELVELITRYDDGDLDQADRRRFDEHLTICDACVTYYDQLRQVARVTGQLDDDAPVDPEVVAALLAAFRGAGPGA
jgi:anti-sigma factor RsiW